jgi:hypothetical protein
MLLTCWLFVVFVRWFYLTGFYVAANPEYVVILPRFICVPLCCRIGLQRDRLSTIQMSYYLPIMLWYLFNVSSWWTAAVALNAQMFALNVKTYVVMFLRRI